MQGRRRSLLGNSDALARGGEGKPTSVLRGLFGLNCGACLIRLAARTGSFQMFSVVGKETKSGSAGTSPEHDLDQMLLRWQETHGHGDSEEAAGPLRTRDSAEGAGQSGFTQQNGMSPETPDARTLASQELLTAPPSGGSALRHNSPIFDSLWWRASGLGPSVFC